MDMNDAVVEVKEYEQEYVESKTAYLIVKRLFDLFFSILGCLLLIPIVILIKIAFIITGDLGPIMFSQDRIGKNGKLFKFYKFRTMILNADKILFEYLENDKKAAKEYKINKKLRNDPRITKLGKILRKTSIDELPQVINILFGHMSLIGNRPYLPREKEDMGFYFNVIVKTKPGLTGYWQVSGRSDVSFKKRLELEQYYSNNFNLKMDLKIFFKTIKSVLKSCGAK